MDKYKGFSIETLFPSEDGTRPYANGTLDIDTLFSNNLDNKNEDRKFNSDILLKGITERRKRIRKVHVEMYNLCCSKIQSADSLGLTDIVFELPEYIPECPEFKHRLCIDYISTNLRKESLDTYMIDQRHLFITWKYVELNKEEYKNRKTNVDV
jgi:hypothetical protein